MYMSNIERYGDGDIADITMALLKFAGTIALILVAAHYALKYW